METKRVQEIVHSLRQKPLHVRENMALGLAGGFTFLVALLWAGVMVASGGFSLVPTSIASAASASAPTVQTAVSSSKDNFSNLLGAAGAALGASSSPATITVVDTQVHSTLDQPQTDPNATVIHF